MNEPKIEEIFKSISGQEDRNKLQNWMNELQKSQYVGMRVADILVLETSPTDALLMTLIHKSLVAKILSLMSYSFEAGRRYAECEELNKLDTL